MRNDNGLSVIARISAILQTFRDTKDGLTSAAVSRRTGIPQSTCHRILTALTEERLLEKSPDARYHVGLTLWQITARSPRAMGIQRIALPYMQDLYEITRYPVHLAIREGDRAVFIERLAPSGKGFQRPVIGSTYPLHVTAVGRVLLAYTSPQIQEDYFSHQLERVTEFTETDPEALRLTLAEVRSKGFAVADRQVNSQALSVAAPIWGPGGTVQAAISANVPFDLKNTASLAHAVQVIARSITRSYSSRTGD